MPGLLSECQEHFQCNDLYSVLGVDKKCKQTELRKAFYKQSLLHHPDRQIESLKTEATVKFQILSNVYAILSDSEKRDIYDETGIVDDEDSLSSRSYDDWVDYWQLLFPKVTPQLIDDFCERYKGSDQELNDLADIYERCKGDMDVIMESMLLADYSDEARVRSLIEQLIKEGKVEAHAAYVNEKSEKVAKRAKKATKEAKLFEKHRAKSSKEDNNMNSLAAAIMVNRDRQLKFSENFLDKLTEKYAKPNLKNAKRKSDKPHSSDKKNKK